MRGRATEPIMLSLTALFGEELLIDLLRPLLLHQAQASQVILRSWLPTDMSLAAQSLGRMRVVLVEVDHRMMTTGKPPGVDVARNQ